MIHAITLRGCRIAIRRPTAVGTRATDDERIAHSKTISPLGARPSAIPRKIAKLVTATTQAVIRSAPHVDIFRLLRALRNRCQHRTTFLGSADVLGGAPL